ncbi:MAG: hypothetical protein HC845_13340 [Akkermansiaceae bacterium]|nr:hypothetical protein [Akkermansiaceae bacterium]
MDVPLATDLPAEPAPAKEESPSSSVTLNLIKRLVKKGVLTQEEAEEMIRDAEADARAVQNAARAEIAAMAPPLEPEDTRVTYIPEVVKNNMRDEIKQELMAQAREEKWNENNAPDWTSKFRPFGDLRFRYEGTFFPESRFERDPTTGEQVLVEGNENRSFFTNYNAINNGAPFDPTNANQNLPPSFNVDRDRHRTRLRARLGTEIMLGDGFNGGIRLATGDSSSPVSPNQTLGGSGGNFSKYAIWLDRAFLSYDAGPGDGEELTFLLGRYDNPFFSTDIHWDDDLGFDGLAVRGKVKLNDQVSTFFTAGYFPIFNTDFNFASNQGSKFKSTDKWLTGAQLGIDWKIDDDFKAKFAVAYYDFNKISGELSSPFTPISANDAGDTDSTRPGFSQRGNTYMPLRNIRPTAANGLGTTNQFQYYGLASEFRNLTVTGKLEYDRFEPVRLALVGEVTKNIAFDQSDVASRAFSNGRIGRTIDKKGDFEGGDLAWNLAFQVGKPAMEKFGDWQAAFGYRYVESDAVVDGFTDSDFGGTNVQGFTLSGSMAITPAVRLGLRWLSSDEVDGPAFSSDTLLFDVNAKF